MSNAGLWARGKIGANREWDSARMSHKIIPTCPFDVMSRRVVRRRRTLEFSRLIFLPISTATLRADAVEEIFNYYPMPATFLSPQELHIQQFFHP